MRDVTYELVKTLIKIIEENSAQIDILHKRLTDLEDRVTENGG